jgi:membrane protein insertase Oxa1/YidC/SpoIIIJ
METLIALLLPIPVFIALFFVVKYLMEKDDLS